VYAQPRAGTAECVGSMVNRLIAVALRNRFIVVVLYLGLAGWGWWALAATPIDAIPDLSDNQVIVFTDWPGHSPQEVEDQVTYPLTTNLQGLAGVRVVRSQSAFGFSMIYVVFEDDVDLYFARTRVLERMSLVAKSLPAGVVPTLGPDATGVGHVFWYTVESPTHSLRELRTLQDWFVRYQLNAVPGVAEVASVGGHVQQYQVDVDPNRLRLYDLPLSAVVAAVRDSNLNVGGNVLESNGAWLIVRGVGLIESVADALLRLRPKVMTVSTVIAGLLPIMWSTNVGAEVMKPLAAPVLGGMVSSLVHVLIVTPVIFFWVRERRLGLQHEPLPKIERRTSRRGVLIGAAVVAVILVATLVVWRIAAPDGDDLSEQGAAGVVQTIRSGDLEIVLLSPTGTLRQGRNSFTIEFRRAGTETLVDVGSVRASANMPMPGMVMSGGLQVMPTGAPGRFAATAEFGMAGAWQMAIEWDGPAGRGSVSFEGAVQ
jgi:hypothetical protein